MGSHSEIFDNRPKRKEAPLPLDYDEIIALKERLHVDDGGIFIARVSARLAIENDATFDRQNVLRIEGSMTKKHQREFAIYYGELSAMIFVGLNIAKDRPEDEWPQTVPAPAVVAEVIEQLDMQDQAAAVAGRAAVSTEMRNG